MHFRHEPVAIEGSGVCPPVSIAKAVVSVRMSTVRL